MAYVDLNPVRAKMTKTPEQSDYTSVRERIRQQLGKYHAADKLLTMDGSIILVNSIIWLQAIRRKLKYWHL